MDFAEEWISTRASAPAGTKANLSQAVEDLDHDLGLGVRPDLDAIA